LLIDAHRAARSRPAVVQALPDEDAETDPGLGTWVLDRELNFRGAPPPVARARTGPWSSGPSTTGPAWRQSRMSSRHSARHGDHGFHYALLAAPSARRKRRGRVLMRAASARTRQSRPPAAADLRHNVTCRKQPDR
jgi:hypothetical protein